MNIVYLTIIFIILQLVPSVHGFTNNHLKVNNKYRSNDMMKCKALIDLQTGEFENVVINSDKPVIVDFMANWCGPCKLVTPIFKKLADDFVDEVKFVKVDTDIHEETVDKYNIQGLPLFGIFINGEMVASHSGALSTEPLRDFIKKNIKK